MYLSVCMNVYYIYECMIMPLYMNVYMSLFQFMYVVFFFKYQ